METRDLAHLTPATGHHEYKSADPYDTIVGQVAHRRHPAVHRLPGAVVQHRRRPIRHAAKRIPFRLGSSAGVAFNAHITETGAQSYRLGNAKTNPGSEALHIRDTLLMSGLLIGYARVSTVEQDLAVQRAGLEHLGVDPDRIYVDHGLTGTTRARPGLREALAACRSGDSLVVTKLDRLARSLPDARDIADELTARQVKLNLGGSVYDPTDAIGRLLFNVLAMVAEFEADLIRMRTREGMAAAKAKGRLRSKQPKLKPRQEAHLVELYRVGGHTTAELAELFGVARSTVYRAVHRTHPATAAQNVDE